MIDAEYFVKALSERGLKRASGVPCSHFAGPISVLSRTPGRYVSAANEGTALATVAGFALAGEPGYLMLQNSGLGNLINPLTSLVQVYQVPTLSFVSLRGWPDPADDEPQHATMGPATPAVLRDLGVPTQIFRTDHDTEIFDALLDRAIAEVGKGQAPFIMVERGAVAHVDTSASSGEQGIPSREAATQIIEALPDATVVATTGYTARELFSVSDRVEHFYMQGSMGHASSLGLGIALTRPEHRVIVLDGDAATSMHLGALATIGAQAPQKLVHIVFDNGVHESTGGQVSTSSTTDFTAVALGAGYAWAGRCRSNEDLSFLLTKATSTPGPGLIHVRTRRRTGSVPQRATTALSPVQLRERFTANLVG